MASIALICLTSARNLRTPRVRMYWFDSCQENRYRQVFSDERLKWLVLRRRSPQRQLRTGKWDIYRTILKVLSMLNSFDVACLICTPKFRTRVVRRYSPECIVHRWHDHAVATWDQEHPGHTNKFCTASLFAAKANALKRFKTQFPIEQFDHGSSTSGKGNTVLCPCWILFAQVCNPITCYIPKRWKS